MDWDSLWQELWRHHRGKSIGVLGGLIFGVLTALFGLWKAVFIVFAIGLGYLIGKKVDESGGFFEWLERIFRGR